MTRILVDVITNITFHNGVVRVECGTVGPDGKANPSGSLLIPAPVTGQVLQALIVLFVAEPPLVRTIFRLRAARGGGVGASISKGWNA